jgi:predicted DCC family thiol-disulfide oxidoreductase YuxK
VMEPRPVLVYDGDCAFCSSSVRFAERWIRPVCEITPWQFADLGALGVTQARAEHEVLWVTPVGTVHGGARAVSKLLLSARGIWTVPGALLNAPGVRLLADAVYRLVADNRERMPGGTPACALPADRRPVPGS